MTVQRMDHVSVVVEDLEAAVAFFVALGLEREGGAMPVAGDWVDRVNGLPGVHVDITMLRTPDGHGRLELTRFHHPKATTAEPDAPSNTIGYRSVMFAVDDLQATVRRLEEHGGTLIGEVGRYEDLYLLCYVRGPGGTIVALAEELG